MNNFNIDISTINLSDYTTINEYISLLGKEDTMVISVKTSLKNEYEQICEILKLKNIMFVDKKDGDRRIIYARCKKKQYE